MRNLLISFHGKLQVIHISPWVGPWISPCTKETWVQATPARTPSIAQATSCSATMGCLTTKIYKLSICSSSMKLFLEASKNKDPTTRLFCKYLHRRFDTFLKYHPAAILCANSTVKKVISLNVHQTLFSSKLLLEQAFLLPKNYSCPKKQPHITIGFAPPPDAGFPSAEAKVLKAFQRTMVLKPNQTEILELRFPSEDLALYSAERVLDP